MFICCNCGSKTRHTYFSPFHSYLELNCGLCGSVRIDLDKPDGDITPYMLRIYENGFSARFLIVILRELFSAWRQKHRKYGCNKFKMIKRTCFEGFELG